MSLDNYLIARTRTDKATRELEALGSRLNNAQLQIAARTFDGSEYPEVSEIQAAMKEWQEAISAENVAWGKVSLPSLCGSLVATTQRKKHSPVPRAAGASLGEHAQDAVRRPAPVDAVTVGVARAPHDPGGGAPRPGRRRRS